MVIVVEQKKTQGSLQNVYAFQAPSLPNSNHDGGGGGGHSCCPVVMAVVNVCHQRLTITHTAMYFVLVIELMSIKNIS